MSLEIREMILRTTLIDNKADNGGKKQVPDATAVKINTEHIIAECVERVMERLREENER